MEDPLGSARIHKDSWDSLGLARFRLDSQGFAGILAVIREDSLGFARVPWDSLGFAGIRQDFLGFARIRWDSL